MNFWTRVENALLYSSAFAALCGHAVKTLLWSFMQRPVESKADRKRRKRFGLPEPKPGPFSFPYATAECYGLTRKQFAAALRELVAVGFLDVAHKGSARQRDFSLYAWSDRWRKFGTADFVSVPFPESLRHVPRGADGRWQPMSPKHKTKNTPTPMTDIRNRAGIDPLQSDGIDVSKGEEVPYGHSSKGRIVPLFKGSYAPLTTTLPPATWEDDELVLVFDAHDEEYA